MANTTPPGLRVALAWGSPIPTIHHRVRIEMWMGRDGAGPMRRDPATDIVRVVADVTLREVGDLHGYSLKYVRSLSRTAGWPAPVGRRRQPRGPGTYAYVYDRADVDVWMRNHRLGSDQWTMDRIAVEFGVSVEMIWSARKRGQFPAADGFAGRPWWHASSARGWWASRQVPDGAWRPADVADHVGLKRPQKQSGFPPPDGVTGRARWWWPSTIREWWAPHAERRRAQVQTRADAERRVSSETADRWFSRDVAARTGLSYESVRTYRRLRKLPEPDGILNGRPWWRPTTIRAWNRPSATGRPRRAEPVDD